MGGTCGFSVRYASRAALDRDHAAYLIHGGLVIPFTGPNPPSPNTRLTIRIEEPAGNHFDLAGQVGQVIPGRGFMVSFEAASRPAQAALDRFVQNPVFQAALQDEPDDTAKPPQVVPLSIDRPTVPAAPPPKDMAPTPGPAGPAPIDNVGTTAPPGPSGALHPDVEAAVPGAPSSPSPPATSSAETELRRPGPGDSYWVFVLKFATLLDYVEHAADFAHSRQLRIPRQAEHEVKVNDPARIRLTLPGHNVFEIWAVVERVLGSHLVVRVSENDEQFRKAVLHPETVAGRKRLERERPEHRQAVVTLQLRQDVPLEDIEKMPIRRRLQRMGMDDKINLALSGNREERMALASDSNRAVHHYLLKNAKITMDEIAFMARLPSLNPDVLDKIAENPAYVQNPTVVKALVYNPKTPVKTAIRLLDRLSRPEVMNLSKRMTMNRRLVMAAKKKVERNKG